MNVGVYATLAQARVLQERDAILQSYEKLPEVTRFWGFVDLVGSSNYRLRQGAKWGYVRGEMLYTLLDNVTAPSEVEVVKLMGDGALMVAPSFRALFEALLLCHCVVDMIDETGGDEELFRIRSAIGFGAAKRIRRKDDYLGSAIDQLSRVMAVREAATNLLVQSEAMDASGDVIREYPFCHVGEAKMLNGEAAKGLAKNLFYYEIHRERKGLMEYASDFVPWRESMKGRTRGA